MHNAQPLGQGDAITAWAASTAVEEYFPGIPRPMPDRVDYRFRNGWVDTGDLPCRQALLASQANRKIPCPTGAFTELAVANDGAQLDFSTFRHRPTLIKRAFRCDVLAETDALARFKIATCGGLRVWINETPIATFEPFKRNTPSETEIVIPLSAGRNRLILHLEDLHERDTTNFFSFILIDGPTLRTTLPEGMSPDAAAATADVLAGLQFDSVFQEPGNVELLLQNAPPETMQLSMQGPAQFMRGGISADPTEHHRSTFMVTPSNNRIIAFDASTTTAGCQHLSISATVNGATATRDLGTTIVKTGIPLPDTLSARKTAVADHIALNAKFEPSVALILARRGEKTTRMANIVAATLTTIEDRHDCSDFSILPLLRLWQDARDQLDPKLRARMKAAFLGYRYWLTEPGNDVMWFWSENHVLCFHTAQIVAGQLFPDETFTNSGRTGGELATEALERLHRWFASIAEHGLCEWNSAAYYPIDMLGLFTLHDMVPELRSEAAEVLDQIFAMVALHTSGDVPAGSQGRCYEKEILAGAATELGTVAAIAFGCPYLAGYDRAAALFCVSDYAPPAGLSDFWQPPEGRSLAAHYTQGLDHAGKLNLWKSADIQLSSATSETAGQKGHQSQVVDVQAAAHPMARLWINHPGELKEWGDRRPSLLAGNHVMPHVAQTGDTAVLLYDLDRDWTDLKFTQLFAIKHAFEPPVVLDDWWVFTAGKGHVAVWCSAGLEPVSGTYAGSLWRAHALRVGWVLTVSHPGETRDTLANRLRDSRPVFDPQEMSLQTLTGFGDRLAIEFAGETRLNGKPMPFRPLSPIPHVGWDGGTPTVWNQHAADT